MQQNGRGDTTAYYANFYIEGSEQLSDAICTLGSYYKKHKSIIYIAL